LADTCSKKILLACVKGITMRCHVVASMLLMLFGAASVASANEHGRGLGRALNQAGKSVSAPGLNKAGPSVSRAGSGLNRAPALQRAPALSHGPLNKVAGGHQGVEDAVAGGATDPAATHQRQLQIEQRNRDQRLAQAQKLRALADKNGDTELAANADRMEAQAQQHYADRVNQLGRFGVSDPSLNPAQGTDVVATPPAGDGPLPLDAPITTTTTTAPSETPKAAVRSSWLPKLWGKR
jgi:hypothetical protein